MITNDHLLAGPYALDAIDGDELTAYEDHLEDCATCELEVAEFRETAALLAQGVAQPVPAGLLDRVLAEVRTTAQLPPLVPFDDANVVPLARRRRPRWLMSVAAAVVILLGAVAAITLVSRNQPTRYDSAMGAPGRTVTLSGDGPSAELKRIDGSDDGALTATLPPLTDDKTYQLWFIDDGGPHSATTFTPDEQGNVRVAFDQPVSQPSAFGITVEPAGGSAQPTPPIVLQGAA